MNNKTKKAIKNLQKQKAKIDGGASDQTWITKTQSCISDYFGKESREFKFIDEFRFTGLNTTPETIQGNKLKAKRFLEDCIETLTDKGIYKPPRKNFLHAVSDEAIAGLIVGIGGGLFYLGFLAGNRSSDVKNIELKQTVSKLQDTIQIQQDTLTILRLRASQKDTIKSLQDPAHKAK